MEVVEAFTYHYSNSDENESDAYFEVWIVKARATFL